MNIDSASLGYLAIRFALGVIFVFYGVWKLFDLVGFNGMVRETLPWIGIASWAITVLIVFGELIIGICLILGIQTNIMLFWLILHLTVLNAGVMLQGMQNLAINESVPVHVGRNLNYIVLAAIGLIFSKLRAVRKG